MRGRKKTMLLTVIAVATLLVAVVGATFAYFSLSTSGGSSTTATISTPKVGKAVISSIQPSLKLTLTAANMAKDKAGTTYYATKSGNNSESPVDVPITQVTLSGAQDGAKYSCVTNVSVNVDESAKDMLESLKEGWAKLVLKGTSVNDDEQTIDLFEFKTLEEPKTFTGTAEVTATSSESVTQNILSAQLSFANIEDSGEVLNSGNQNDIAGKTLTVNITVTGGTCTLLDSSVS